MLTGFFGLTQHQAHGTSLAVIGATALAAIIGLRRPLPTWRGRSRCVVALGSMVTARYGARWAARISPRGLRRAFAVFLVAGRAPAAVAGARGRRATPVIGGLGRHRRSTCVLGAAVGVLSGFMGVGGGILAVPGLHAAARHVPAGGPGHLARRHPGDRAGRGDRARAARERGRPHGPDPRAGGGLGGSAGGSGWPSACPTRCWCGRSRCSCWPTRSRPGSGPSRARRPPRRSRERNLRGPCPRGYTFLRFRNPRSTTSRGPRLGPRPHA